MTIILAMMLTRGLQHFLIICTPHAKLIVEAYSVMVEIFIFIYFVSKQIDKMSRRLLSCLDELLSIQDDFLSCPYKGKLIIVRATFLKKLSRQLFHSCFKAVVNLSRLYFVSCGRVNRLSRQDTYVSRQVKIYPYEFFLSRLDDF